MEEFRLDAGLDVVHGTVIQPLFKVPSIDTERRERRRRDGRERRRDGRERRRRRDGR